MLDKLTEKIKKAVSNNNKNALDSYTLTAYGKSMTMEELFSAQIGFITNLIDNKSHSGCFELLYKFDDKVPGLRNALIQHFKNLEYKVEIIDSKVFNYLTRSYLFISWDI